MKRGEIWWADFGTPSGSEPGYRRPVLIISSNAHNNSNLATVLTVSLTSNLSREAIPGNVRLPAKATGLSKPSVAIVTMISTTNRNVLTNYIGRVPDNLMSKVDAGLRFAMGL